MEKTGISGRAVALPFADVTSDYVIPLALSIPTLSAFRQLLERDGQTEAAHWIADNGFDSTLALWRQVGPTLTKKVVDRLRC